ncbi:hypothetical protein [Chromobacterium haemolyticum]|uniref:hypothetical protein n=1 Tax=Chromobacterium haemolyticum TaxID=394935 RepID=UPI0009DA8782|nr:hypothetical protein [Chromobacterium haemolyticum]OQS38264.1 hypothetical protein B0T39_13935 [Chromobacterium haemolyticum]
MKTLRSLAWTSLAICLIAGGAIASEAVPQQPDVKSFVDSAEICVHLSGELSGEKTSEQMKLVKQTNKTCDMAKRKFKKLDKKYKMNAQEQEVLNQYRDDLSD